MTSKPAISIQDKAYCGGLVDGEGYFYIIKDKHHSAVYMRAGLKIAMIDQQGILEKAKNLWGGWGKTRKARTDRHKATMEWVIEGKNVEKLIDDILPFLVGKKRQAEVVKEFRRFVSTNNIVTGDIQVYREHLLTGLKGLHHSTEFVIDEELKQKAEYEAKMFKRKFSYEHRQKLSESHKGLITKGMFKPGHSPWTKGRKLSEEHKRKIGLANSKKMSNH